MLGSTNKAQLIRRNRNKLKKLYQKELQILMKGVRLKLHKLADKGNYNVILYHFNIYKEYLVLYFNKTLRIQHV